MKVALKSGIMTGAMIDAQFSRLNKNGRIYLGLFFALFSSFLSASSVAAAAPNLVIKDRGYSAEFVSQSVKDPLIMEAGSKKTVIFKFRNSGAADWNNSGRNFISAYTVEPKYRGSAFKGKNWISAAQTDKMKGTIKPGEAGELAIEFAAPKKVGEYIERFYLSAENKTWLKNGYFFIKIKVIEKKTDKADAKLENDAAATGEVSYKINKFMQAPTLAQAKGGEQIKLILAFQNIGQTVWKEHTISLANSLALAADGTKVSFADESWKDKNTLIDIIRDVPPDNFIRQELYFRAPKLAGKYTASFRFTVDGRAYDEGIINVPVTVTENARYDYVEPVFADAPAEIPRLASEPRIRVGLWSPDTTVQFISVAEDYSIFKGTEAAGLLPKNTPAALSYNDGIYKFKAGDLEFTTSDYIRLEPANDRRAVFKLVNYDHRVSWKGPRNFNQYRGAMEYRITQNQQKLYVINDLLFEDYVAGVAENADTSPYEYLKSQATAQRTYAYYIAEYSTKHDKRNFDVVATTGDQLYLGVESEGIMPNFVRAAAETRGFMVTYNNNIAITPYFGNTNGSTRTWKEAWGGTDKAWLQPVKAEYDARDFSRMNGHGVGMSQHDAAVRAKEEGLNWVALLKYYYTGVEVKKIYH